MKLTNEFEPIRNWATEKGIYKKGDIKTQYIKLQEEAGELAKAIINNDNDEIIDAIGDCVVVLTSIAYFQGITIEDCINSAYDVISKRNGKMINGSFVKNK
jgi:NTP pyrophosphatase (non-canonical NTP hydrolase)